MHLETPAIVCALLAHGEHGAVVRFLTPGHGLLAGYVRGGRSSKLRPVLQPGNSVALSLNARTDSQLAAATVELTRARTALAADGASLAAIAWFTALTATALAEDDPHPAIHMALEALLDGIAAEMPLATLGESLVRFELLLLSELGFGLDLTSCAATGSTEDLAYVSPKSAQAVSRGAGLPWAARLLPLPGFLIGQAPASPAAIAEGLKLSGYFLERDLINGRAAAILPARQQLIARLKLP